MISLSVDAEDGETELFGTLVSDMQTDVVVGDDSMTGTLKYLDDPSAALVQHWGAGNFLALKFESDADEVKAGLDPSQGSGLVVLDEDMNGVWQIADNSTQKFKVVATKDGETKTKVFDLSSLVCEEEEAVVEEENIPADNPEEPGEE